MECIIGILAILFIGAIPFMGLCVYLIPREPKPPTKVEINPFEPEYDENHNRIWK